MTIEDLPPARPARIVDGQPLVVLIEPPGMVGGWVMTPSYARDLAAVLLGAALTVETANERSS